MTEWLRIMLDEIARRRAEREAARIEEERRELERLEKQETRGRVRGTTPADSRS
jgi:hypothetical protein